MNNKELITKSLHTLCEILADRKKANINPDTISSIVDMNYNKTIFDIVFDKIKIIYYLPNKFKWPDLRKHLDEIKEENNYDSIILIVKEKLSQNNVKLINNMDLHIETIDIKELQFNITKHVLVPKHELITDEDEIKNIIENLNIKNKYQLPHIMKTDAMSRYLGLKSGDIVKITRTSPTAGEYIVYRCCI